MIRINGNAAANEIVWSGFNPPAIRRPTAITDWIIPQRIFLLFGGLISPSVVSMDRTYTPELADVIKTRREIQVPQCKVQNQADISEGLQKVQLPA